MAIHITRLNGGNITIGSDGGSSEQTSHTYTRFTFSGGTHEDYEIIGTLDSSFMAEKGWYDDVIMEFNVQMTSVDIGTTVTSIGGYTFFHCNYLQSIIIPEEVTSIDDAAFVCDRLTSVTFEGKDRATVQGMQGYPFGFDLTSGTTDYEPSNVVTIHCSDGDITISR